VISDWAKPTLLLREAEDVVVNPIFQAKSQRPLLRGFRCERPVLFKKTDNESECSAQPIGNTFLGLEDCASPETELLPLDVLIASLLKALP
jgi:hypothetical protein